MKKTTKFLALALALVLALGLAGCGAKTASMTDSYYSERISSAPMEASFPFCCSPRIGCSEILLLI